MVEKIIQQKNSHFLEDQCLEIFMVSAIFLSAILVVSSSVVVHLLKNLCLVRIELLLHRKLKANILESAV